MIFKERQNRDIYLHQLNKRMVLVGNMTRYSCFKSGYTLGPTKKLPRHLFFSMFGHGVITDNSNLGHGSLNKNMA
jgi:hypothetical protein